MQIIYNPTEVNEIVLGYVQEKLNLDDSNDFQVSVGEDGSIVVLVNEEAGEHPSSSGDQPTPTSEKPAKRSRRTKAQIEADEKAAREAAASANGGEAGNVEPTPTTSADSAKPTETAQVADAGDPTQTEAEPESTSPGTPEPEAATTQADPEPEPEVAPEPEDVAAATQPEVKPEGVSLFKNLRRVQNGA